ncbi:MAG: hydrogenase [Desulfobulbaceae bacterium]|jgi:hydrogenase-4 component E|nr:hydrogenase [Desulfobulbaceae bacterium]MDY0350343.1 hydrogenase [Desulfobulbaceae bacterium]
MGHVDIVLSLIFLSILMSLGSSRLLELIRVMSFQGVLVSLVPVLIEPQYQTMSLAVAFASLMLLIKGVLIPLMIWFALRKVSIRREVEPLIGYHASLFAGLAMILFSVFISSRLQVVDRPESTLLLPCAITTIGAGFFLLMTRRKAITQIIGYLILENGIYLTGTALAGQMQTHYVVEFGILLDLLVGVMIMGIILHRINSTYDDIDTTFLKQLKG